MTEDHARWIIGVLLVGLISSVAFILTKYSPKKSEPEKIFWAPQPTTQKIRIDGKDVGCLENGIDVKGYVRWSSVPCADDNIAKELKHVLVKPVK